MLEDDFKDRWIIRGIYIGLSLGNLEIYTIDKFGHFSY